MVAKVALSGQTGQQGMYLPIRAVQQSAGGNLFVWTMADGKAHRSNVSVGETVGDRIQILSGLSEGDKVIVEGYQKVSEGTRVTNGKRKTENGKLR